MQILPQQTTNEPIVQIYRDSLGEALLHQALLENSICLVQDSAELVPMPNADLNRSYLLSIGKHRPASFIRSFREYASPAIHHYREVEKVKVDRMNRSYYQYLVVAIYEGKISLKDLGSW